LRRDIDLDEIEAELMRQIEAFAAALGREPDFLDGHHHVHQLPGIRTVIARTWRTRTRPGWIRNTATTSARILARKVAIPRTAALAVLGAQARRAWRKAGIATNSDFAGVRNFDEPKPFRELMRRYLSDAEPGLLIMCHPGHPDAELARIDSVTTSRAAELAYLEGAEFPADLAEAGCRLVRFSSLAAQ
jgi:predicted glycoside hydrolase/deacetylase ChbG (UPF0249 family)